MAIKIKEIVIISRPNTDIQFHLPDSIYWFETDPTTSTAYKYFTETYVNTGKAEAITNRPIISEDGLTITYETIYNSVAALEEMFSDGFYIEGSKLNRAYQNKNNIRLTEDLIPIE